MPDLQDFTKDTLDPAQALELALLLDLEACWENLRAASALSEAPPSTQGLQGKQKAYDGFRAKLKGYNKRYAPAHVPELLLNTPARLALWCGSMRQLYGQLEHIPGAPCPAHLLEKGYRWANKIADRMGHGRIMRSPAPDTISAVILALEALRQWCEHLPQVALAMGSS
jgi:hypothetical protein